MTPNRPASGSRTPLDRIRAPYNFVPLSPVVVLPEWGPIASHDRPFQEGISGDFEIEIEAKTPIFVRGAQDRQRFFCTPDGEVAIPGSSLRGMLRNVVEIATFSRMRSEAVSDRYQSMRDLDAELSYGREMTRLDRSARGKHEPIPRVGAGWMERNGDDEDVPAVIYPCDFYKVHYNLLMTLARELGNTRFYPGAPQSALQKYAAWGRSPRVLGFKHEAIRASTPKGRLLEFGAVTRLGEAKPHRRKGTLVFTGQPSEWNPERGTKKAKQHDFIFGEAADWDMPVSREVYTAFQQVHSATGQQHKLDDTPNPEWDHWRAVLKSGERIPIFYLVEGGKVSAIGLAMMFRLAGRVTPRGAVRNAQPLPSEDAHRPDLAELLFGRLPNEVGGVTVPGLRGRVSVGLARPVDAGGRRVRPRPDGKVEVVLSSPKPSYYPNYIEQSDSPSVAGGTPSWAPNDRGNLKPDYTTWCDRDARVRGWKRYHPRLAVSSPPPSQTTTGKGAKGDVFTTFHPLPAGTRFRTRIQVHNLLPEELGALLWAIDFGQHPSACHQIGLAKALGYGTVCGRILEGYDLRRVRDDRLVDLQEVRARFMSYMEEECASYRIEGGWATSRQIHELLSIAEPLPATDVDQANLPPGDVGHRHMRLKREKEQARFNEFQAAKREGYVLEPAGGSKWPPE